jgi:succinate-acetate transporter protein
MGKPRLTQTVSNSYTISPKLFEKLYLTPKVPHVCDATKRYDNATPLGLVHFIISSFTFAIVLMGWGCSNGGKSALAGMFLFVGPFLLGLTTISEWIFGNFFIMMMTEILFVFWASYALLELPTLDLAAAHAPPSTAAAEVAATGAISKEHYAAIALDVLV